MRLLWVSALLLAGCASDGASVASRDQQRLAAELAARVAGAPQTCLPVTLGPGSLQPVDDRTLVLRQGRTTWVNRLRAACPSLRPVSTIIIEVRGSQYCRNDRFRAVRPGEIIPGPFCVLGDFVPYRTADAR
ncbi:MAG: hypothetical protein AVDCRST_MAG91-2410 [uncultured Sphingomonadaceae bacterium]|uniref:Uncharacterized protein n=1 Tax=uncultured Sphingomonadaceae bacterium TaxID=169976 RepID=A0A6J4TIY9_9SPHN|nr:MAG: hypothetical protein AVDCRST_MAG91-2410 [uncultured Sphingomonadaceae bacterium]